MVLSDQGPETSIASCLDQVATQPLTIPESIDDIIRYLELEYNSGHGGHMGSYPYIEATGQLDWQVKFLTRTLDLL